MFSAVLRLLPHSELIDVIRTLRGHCENKLAFFCKLELETLQVVAHTVLDRSLCYP